MALIEQIRRSPAPEATERAILEQRFQDTYEQVYCTVKRAYYENFEGFQEAINALDNLCAMYEIFQKANRNL